MKLRRRELIFLHDLVMVLLAWVSAYWLRYNLAVPPDTLTMAREIDTAVDWIPFVMLIQGAVFKTLGLNRGIWRFCSIHDVIRIVKSACLGVAFIAVVVFVVDRLDDVPRSIMLLYVMCLIFFLSLPRFVYRLQQDRKASFHNGKRALIVGAGIAGETLVRDLLRIAGARFHPIAFVDDDPAKKGTEIHGIRVRGHCGKIQNLVTRLDIEVILIAIPSATDKQMQRLVELCEQAETPFLTLPSVPDLASDHISGNLREVSIDDLLGRPSIKLDGRQVRDFLAGKRILVTGGGGSIGSELCSQIARCRIDALAILDRCEFNLYEVERTLRQSAPEIQLKVFLSDITDSVAITRVVKSFKPDIVFHAAAYKHVYLLQDQYREAVRNNIIGTYTVATAAMKEGIAAFILISTDKAVHPSNVMGETKRFSELLIQSMNAISGTRFMTVRFGNVLDSAGSVVPLFREQIKSGGPVTVTHPEVYRYFMTIPEACQLIMQAATVGNGGEVFVLDMGDPVSINYLAEQMIRLSGKHPGSDIAIQYIGLRVGEKLTEELFTQDEKPQPTGHEKLLLISSVSPDYATMLGRTETLVRLCDEYDETAIADTLKRYLDDTGQAQ
ncbi:MAG: hypothetical protein RLZZ226_1347 [Pseudomonadota bacterium]|jgi:FlaA1/EpsC-like NDP-sugar epimerase